MMVVLSVLLNSSMKEFTAAFDILFNIYYPIIHIYDLVKLDISNTLNTIESITNFKRIIY